MTTSNSSPPPGKFRSFDDLRALLPGGGPETPAGPSGKAGHDGKGAEVRLSIERKGRKGKTVTIVAGLRHNPGTMLEIARHLKERCGTGGTVKEGVIELQGDRRRQAAAELEALNYRVRGA